MKPPVVMWGHTLDRPGFNTIAYCWAAYAKAWLALGHQVVHVPDDPKSADAVTSDCLVMSEGQEDKHLPKDRAWRYVPHNADLTTYPLSRTLVLQTYTHDVKGRETRRLAPFVHHQPVPGMLGVLYQPWATDLLPGEFVEPPAKKENRAVWIGTIGDGVFGNRKQLAPFMEACKRAEVPFVHLNNVSFEENRRLVSTSRWAPVIVGAWQKEKGYLPCRAWKNVSYGAPLLTNSETVLVVFAAVGLMGYQSDDTAKLFTAEVPEAVQKAAREYVRKEHTFLNRCRTILECVA